MTGIVPPSILAVCLTAIVSTCLATAPLRAEEIDVKALAREACSNAEIKTKFLDMVEKARGKSERAIFAFEVERDCAHFELPDTPKFDAADPSPEAAHTGGEWGGVLDVHYSPDGKTILSTGHDGTVRLWDAATGKPISHIALPDPENYPNSPPHGAWIRTAIFLGDGSKFAIAADHLPVRVFESATGKQLAEFPVETMYGMAPKIAATSTGLLFIGSKLPDVVALDWASNTVRYKLPDHLEQKGGIAVSEAAGIVATADSTVSLWKLDTGTRLSASRTHNEVIGPIAFSRDGTKIAFGVGNTAVVHEIATKKKLQEIIIHPIYSTFDLAFTADGKGLITCQSHPILWDIESGKLIRHFGPFTDLCQAIDVSPDGKYMVTGHMGSDVRIWEIATGAFERRLGANMKPKG